MIITILEWSFAIALIVGFIFEGKFIHFEERLARKWKAKKHKYDVYNPRDGLYWG